MRDEWLIFPAVRRLVGALAKAALLLLMIAGTGLPGLGLFFLGAYDAGALLVINSNMVFMLYLPLLVLLLLWCHQVLLAGRGLAFSRFLLCFSLFLCLLLHVCAVYTFFCREPLLARQGEIPFLLWGAAFFSFLLNIGNMAAAPLSRKCLLAAHLLLVLLVLILQAPQLVLYCEIAKCLCLASAFPLLRSLARFAPCIVSMPKEKTHPQNTL